MKWFILGFLITFTGLIGTDVVLDSCAKKNKVKELC